MRRLRPLLLATAALAAGAAGAAAQEAVHLSLEGAVRRAAGAPSVQLAALGVEASQTRVRQAGAALLPTLGAGTGWLNRSFNRAAQGMEFPAVPGFPAPGDHVGPFSAVDLRMRASQALYDPASRLAVSAARTGVRESGAEQEAVAETAAAEAATAYAEAGRSRSVVAARAADLALARELLHVARQQLRAGRATPLDVVRAETQQLASEGDSIAAAAAVEQGDIRLARTLGMDPATRFELADSLASPAAVPAGADAAAAGAAARPELRLERARMETLRANGRAIRAERLPRVEVFGDLGWSGTGARNLLPTHQLGVQVSLSLLDGLHRESRLAEQRVLTEQSRLREADLQARVQAEVGTALLELRSAREQLRVADGRVRLATLELAQARVRFREGVAGNTEVLDAQRGLVAARDGMVAAKHLGATGTIRLARATGTARELRGW